MVSKKSKKVKVGIIGLGYWGPNLLRNFITIPNAEVVYGCDINSNNFKKLIWLYPSVKFIMDYQEIIKDESIDLVVIATPLSTHYKLARGTLIAKKHVLLEKPMTKTGKEAKELIKLAKKIKEF